MIRFSTLNPMLRFWKMKV